MDSLERWGIEWNGLESPTAVPMDNGLWTPWHIATEEITRLTAENARLRKNISHCQGRFLNINICLSSGGTKREAIAIADVGEDCCKGYLAYGSAALTAMGDV
jgi:hypothetical protein